jgi:hypothetical protein
MAEEIIPCILPKRRTQTKIQRKFTISICAYSSRKVTTNMPWLRMPNRFVCGIIQDARVITDGRIWETVTKGESSTRLLGNGRRPISQGINPLILSSSMLIPPPQAILTNSSIHISHVISSFLASTTLLYLYFPSAELHYNWSRDEERKTP